MRHSLFAPMFLLIACVPKAPTSLPDDAYERAVARLRDVDSQLPYVDAGFIYYTRVDDDGVRVHCRRAVIAGSTEEILFRDDELASRYLGALQVSPDSRWLAVSTETARDRWNVVLKDLETGEIEGPIEGTDFSVAWDKSGTLYYATLDDNNAPRTVYAKEPKKQARVVHREQEREVMVAPVDDDAALFIKAPRGILGLRLAPGASLEGGALAGPTPTDPLPGGTTTPSTLPRPAAL